MDFHIKLDTIVEAMEKQGRLCGKPSQNTPRALICMSGASTGNRGSNCHDHLECITWPPNTWTSCHSHTVAVFLGHHQNTHVLFINRRRITKLAPGALFLLRTRTDSLSCVQRRSNHSRRRVIRPPSWRTLHQASTGSGAAGDISSLSPCEYSVRQAMRAVHGAQRHKRFMCESQLSCRAVETISTEIPGHHPERDRCTRLSSSTAHVHFYRLDLHLSALKLPNPTGIHAHHFSI